MMASEPSRSSVFADSHERDDFSVDRIRWLITLRWVAMAGVLVATGWVLAGYFSGVVWPVLLVVVAVGSVYDDFLLKRAPGPGTGKRAVVSQALVATAAALAAAALGIDRRTLRRKLRGYGIAAH